MHHTTLITREYCARDTLTLTFPRPEGFTFLAGQYVVLSLPHAPHVGEREFSIVSAPHETTLPLVMRIRHSPFKSECVHMPLGSRVQISEAHGVVVGSDTEKPEVWFAGGIGIAPFISQLRELQHTQKQKKITLVYSARTRDDAPFMDELEQMHRSLPGFTLIPVYTGSEKRISVHTCTKNALCSPEYQYSIVGTRPFVADIRTLLHEQGMQDSQVRSERFCGYTTHSY